MMVQLHPIGILLGLVFVTAIGALFFWMFRVPPAMPLPVVKVRRSLTAVHKILVPVGVTIPSERAVELACRLGHDQKAELVLVHVITVPYTLALDTALPAEEKEAHEALELGCLIAERYGVRAHTRIIRERRAADGVLQVAREEEVDAIVLGVGVKRRVPGPGSEWGQTTAAIVNRAQCEVIVDKVPMEAQPIAFAA
jgi:nucleotide-binding universal stress UspA family protein